MPQLLQSSRLALTFIPQLNASEPFVRCIALPIQCIRKFSTTPSTAATMKRSTTIKKMLREGGRKLSEIPKDIGYLDLLIPPTKKGSGLPPIWKNFKLWWQVVRLRFEIWNLNRQQLKRFGEEHPQYNLNTKDLVTMAFAMYKQMNSAFAAGNHPKEIARVEKICGEKFAKTLTSAMKSRDSKSVMKWKWEKTLSKPKLISIVSTPLIKGQSESELVQAVVRLHGRETLSDDVLEPKSQESYTYIALHSKMWIRPISWQIIGRVEETPSQKIVEMFAYQKGVRREQKLLARQNRPMGPLRRAWEHIRNIMKASDDVSGLHLTSRSLISERPPPQTGDGKK